MVVATKFGFPVGGTVPTPDPISISPDDLGAIGDGITDDTSAVLAAWATGLRIDGKGKTYGVKGLLTMPSSINMWNITFKQLDHTASNCRTLYQLNGVKCELHHVVIDRNGDGSAGTVTDFAGIYITGCNRVLMDDVEVFGDDFGSGVVIADCNHAYLCRVYVHDIKAGTPIHIALTDDSVTGIWIVRGHQTILMAPRIENLTTEWIAQAEWTRFTRGIAGSGPSDFCIFAPEVDFVDQGIDLSGNENATRFSILGGNVRNAFSWAYKCANTTTYGSFQGCQAWRAGLGAFTCSAPGSSVGATPKTSNIDYDGCFAIETGYGGYWNVSSNVAAFSATITGFYTDTTTCIKYRGCQAIANGAPMEYGFLKDIFLNADGDVWVESDDNCTVQGASIDDYYGLDQGLCQRQRNTNFAVAYNAWTAIPWDLTNIDRMACNTGNLAEFRFRRAGVATVSACLDFTAAAGGIRGVRVLLNGVVVKGAKNTAPAMATSATCPQVSVDVPGTVGDIITVEGFQDQTAAVALNIINNSGVTVTIKKFGMNK